MSEAMQDNPKQLVIEKAKKMVEAGFHGIKSKERLNEFLEIFERQDLSDEEAALVDKVATDMLIIFEKGIEHRDKLREFIDEDGWLDNGITKYKNFRRKILKGDTPEECLASVKSWLEMFNVGNIAMQVADEMNTILSMNAEDIHSLSRKHRLNFPGGKEKFVSLFNELKERDFKVDIDQLEVFMFLIDLVSKYTEITFFGQGVAVFMAQYFNALSLVRMAEKEIAGKNDFSKLAKLFFEIGSAYEQFLSYAHQSDLRIIETMNSRRAANIVRKRHVEHDTHKEFEKPLFDFAEPAWILGCKLLHTQMSIVLHMGVLGQKPDKDKVAKMAEELTRVPKALREGRNDRVQDYCPCDELKDICVIGKLLQKKKKAYLLQFAHKQNAKEALKSWQFKSVDDVKAALYKKKKS